MYMYTLAPYYVLICSSQFKLNHCHSQYKYVIPGN